MNGKKEEEEVAAAAVGNGTAMDQRSEPESRSRTLSFSLWGLDGGKDLERETVFEMND